MSIPPSAASPSVEPFPRPEVGDPKVADTLDFLLEHLSRSPGACKTETAEDYGQASAQAARLIERFGMPVKQDDPGKFAAALEAGVRHGYLSFEPCEGGFFLRITAKAAGLRKLQEEIRARAAEAHPDNPYRFGPW